MDRDRDIHEEQLRREAETNRTAGRPVDGPSGRNRGRNRRRRRAAHHQ